MTDHQSRRRLLAGAAALAGAALGPAALARPLLGAPRDGDDPFTLGVASGEPAPDGFVIWTRLAPRPLQPDGGMPDRRTPVRWEVAEDPGFRYLAARGQALAGPAAGHAVHVEVTGLRPGREYWYRFTTPAGASPTGRALTAPEPGSAPDRLRLIFASCQKYEAGFYGAWRHAAAEHPDLILFLGDYIYEGQPGSKEAVRLHRNPEPVDLAGYRVRYATYKSDPLLQAAHAAAPWMVMWDDHDVSNDYGADHDEDQNLDLGGDASRFLRRRAAAYQAYYEHMPLRRRARPVGPDMLLHRTLDWGRLAQLRFVDDRQHRSLRVCLPPSAGRGKLIPDCEERRSPARSMLGQAQERWLLDGMASSRARWNVLAQQTLFAPMRLRDAKTGAPAYSSDGWDGSPATRERIAARWRDARVLNPLVLGGDIHAFAAADVRSADDRVAAPSFVGGSLTSLGAMAAETAPYLSLNADIKQFDGTRRGYGRVDLRADGGAVEFRTVADARREDTGVSTLSTYRLEPGRPGVLPA